MLKREFLEKHEDGTVFYRVYSDTEGMGVLQVESGIKYGEVAITDEDPYTYEECMIETVEEQIEEPESV